MNKKVLLASSISLLAAVALTGCQKSSGKADWNAKQKKLMQQALYGETLPYVDGIKNLELSANEELTAISVYGLNSTPETLEKYASKFNSDEWVFYENSASPYIYTFEKKVTVDSKDRYIRAQFSSMEETGYPSSDGNGDFYLFSADPYVYEWPSEYISSILEYYGSEVVVPSVNGSRFELYGQDLNLVAYDLADENPFESFSTSLTSNGFTILSIKDSYGYTLANPSDNKFTISFKYLEQEKALDIYFEVNKQVSWPLSNISALYQKYNQEFFYFPTIDETDGGLYSIQEDEFNEVNYSLGDYSEINATITVSQFKNGFETTYSNYKTALMDDGWLGNEDSDTGTIVATKELDGYKHKIIVYADAKASTISIKFYIYGEKLPYTSWPTDLIKDSLPSYVTDTIPAFSGENNGFKYDSSSWTVTVLVDAATAVDELNAYGALLKNNSWEGVTNGEDDNIIYYASPNHQLLAYLGIYGEGEISVRFELNSVQKDDPMNELNACLVDIGLKANIIPSFYLTGASWSFMPFSKEEKKFTINSMGVSYQDGAVLFNSIKQSLKDNGYVDVTSDYSEEESDNDLYFLKASENILINLYSFPFEPDPEIEGDVGSGDVYLGISYVESI